MFGLKFCSLGKLVAVLTVGISLLGCSASQEEAENKTPEELEESRQEHIQALQGEL
ncbi:MAG: hypothetical protein GXP26_06505 [Planctomycetes bacterium]|nr:hypothetical protein [Planctomycetota bacterium]